ncbi:RHS repeat-associated core domain-containing protein [Paractinoplanes toevensis]|nr:RHS repeat-associated core domain-containing protein [Actinoplanes toevensis]
MFRPRVAAIMSAALIAGLLQAPAAHAAKPGPYTPPAAKPVPTVPVKAPKAQPAVAEKALPQASARPAPVWPKASTQVVDTAAATSTGLPVRVARSAQPGPSRVRVEMLDRPATERAGIRGVLMRVARADGASAAAPAKVSVDYRSFATAYGADWSSRLRLVSLPACALTTPAKAECAATPLKSTNDLKAQTVSADLAVSSTQTLVAATAAPSGPAGSYGASTLSPSSTWSAGRNTGEFTWSYAMRTPPGLGGPAPDVALNYSSQSVDGMHAASNNQPSWVGEGFATSAGGFIERSYQSCAEDMDGSANNTQKTGDLCWETSNATLSLSGHSGELLYNAAEDRWHLRSDDGSRIERKTGATNGDNDGEYWVVTTTDGVQYWFGLNRLPGWASGNEVTNSTLTVPVFGNDPGEPCHATTFADSDCTQAWRWNLDYVVDPRGNSMSLWYQKETNKYARNLETTDAASYDRASWLDHIDYGTRKINSVDSVLSTTPPMRVDFAVADRCLSDCATHDATHWSDVPWDLSCTGTTCADDFSPTFWSTKRLASVTTQVRRGSSLSDVERWTLTHTYPDPGDGTRAGLWLSKLSHVGLVGGSATVPDVEFTPVQMANRVDTIDFAAAMNWMRITRIRTDSGGSISVNYSEQDCKAGETRPTPETNTRRCYPVRWVPEGYTDPVTDWFNKYVVTTIYENDNTGGLPPGGSPRIAYSYSYLDGAAWHYTDDDGMVKKNYKTWSDYRGYGRVGVTIGDAGEQTYTETRYFRGMNGDRLNAAGGSKPVSVDGIADDDWFAGATRETKTLNGPAGTVVSRMLNTPWASAATATRTINGDTVTARFSDTGTTTSHVTLDGGRGERVARTVTSFDSYGMPTAVDDLGLDGVAGDEQCTLTDYVRNTGTWIISRVQRERRFAVKCADTGGTLTEADVIGETRTSYDGQAYGAAPTKGLPTQTQQLTAWNSGSPTFGPLSKASYDVHGRPTTIWDPLNNTSTTAYTPASDGPVTATSGKNPLLHETKTTLEPAWGLPIAAVDPNAKRTDITYDPLGRTTALWAPGRTKDVDTATANYAYTLSTVSPNVVATSALNAAGAYNTSYTLYDGLLRQRQTQSPSPSGGRIITEQFYDTAGRESLSFGSYHTTGEPGGSLLTATDKAFVPRQSRTVYDGAGRTTAAIFQPYGVERWRTTTGYGGDRVDVTPPTGGTAASTVTDVRGRTVELRQYHGTAPTPQTAGTWDATTYTFDRRGYQTAVTDALGNTWTSTYDVRGRTLQTIDPDKGKSTFTYDNAGNVVTATDAREKKIAYAYDPLNRKRAAYDNQVGGTARAAWLYDTVAKGYLTASTRYFGSAGYQFSVAEYNDNYQPTKSQYIIPATETGLAGTYSYSTAYNVDGSVKLSKMPSTNTGLEAEELDYGYNALGMPTTLNSVYGEQNLSYVDGVDYSALGELEQIGRYLGSGGHVYTAYTRELETGRVTGIRTDRDTVTPNTLSDTTYSYNPASNITKITDVAPDPVDDTQCFSYDYLSRLTEAWTPAAGDCAAAASTSLLGGPAAYWNSWQYDAIGNRTKQTVHSSSGDATTDYTYPASGLTAVRPHALTGTTGDTTGSYTYDATGNMLTRPTVSAGTQTMTWDPEGHLDTTTDTTGQTTYIYDADGNRLVSRDPTGRTLYLPGQEIRYNTSTATTSCTRYYSLGSTLIASRTSTALTWLASDGQGTAQVAVDVGTQQATVRRQTPFGTERGTAGAWPNNKGFLGGTKDNTGLTHLGAREYDPATGRFISVDPIQDLADPQQWNAYAYANNSPVAHSDPTGLRIDSDGNAGDTDFAGTPGVYRKNISTGSDPSDSDDDSGSGGSGSKGTSVAGSALGGLKGYYKGMGRAFSDATVGVWYGLKAQYENTQAKAESDANAYLNGEISYWELLRRAGQEGLGVAFNGDNTWHAIEALWAEAKGMATGATPEERADHAGYLVTNVVMAIVGSKVKFGRACSFAAATLVLMADGTTKKISELGRGDEVLAADPETGEQGARRIDTVWAHDDDLYELYVDGNRIVTTEDHPFWNETDHRWENAEALDTGDLVRTPTGFAHVTGFNAEAHQYAVAYNLTVNDIHTYYVLAGTTPVLVHNCGDLVGDAAKFPGSHVLDEHVNVTPQRAANLAAAKGGRNSVFIDGQTAQQVVDYGLAGNQRKIQNWLRGSDQQLPLRGRFGAPNSIGTVYRADGSSSPAGNGYFILLQRAKGHSGGYYVHTAYPE